MNTTRSNNTGYLVYIIYFCIISTTSTTPQADNATVSRLFSLKAKKTATMQPITAEITLPVDVKIAGNVIAPSTAYGTYARNDLKNLFLILFRKTTNGTALTKYVTSAITRRNAK